MKANAGKRKIFDAVDLLAEDAEKVPENGVQMLSVDAIAPFANHPFHLYEGERLSDMVESIREHGVLVPVIVRQTEGGYEMLAGHNRQNAARLAGMKEIPAIVKKDLSDQDAYVYVIETNVIQRSFSELRPSEKAAVLALRYEKITCQGRRNDIVEEIAQLSGVEVPETCVHDEHKLKSRDSLGEEYGLSGSSVNRLLRVNQLVPEFKDRLDAGEISLVAAVDLSYLPNEEQKRVSAKQGLSLEPKTTKVLKEEAGGLDDERLAEIADGKLALRPAKGMSVKIPAEMREKYFAGASAKDVAAIVEQALAAWFERKEEEVV